MMDRMQWKTDDFGMVLGPQYHDGELISLSYHKNSCFSASIQTVGNSITNITASNIGEIHISDIPIGAIVSEIFIWRIQNIKDNFSMAPDSGWNALAYQCKNIHYLSLFVKKIVSTRPDAFLLEISCSYGGSISLICDDVYFYTEKPKLNSGD